jgi:branched-chain amino acid transport system ATP-binding protein
MIDELSFGLAPVLVDQLFAMVLELRKSGTTFLLVEQHAGALEIADRAYVFKVGRNDIDGDAASMRESGNLVRSYLGA